MENDSRRRLQCSLCQRLFRRTEHLTRHERSHRNEKPFSCNYCDARFTRKDLIKGHMSRHHKDSMNNGNGQSSLPEVTATSTAHYASGHQTESLPQLWEPSGQEGAFGSNLNLDEILANAEILPLTYFTSDASSYAPAQLNQNEFRNDTLSERSPSNSNTLVPSLRPPNAAPSPESMWQTSFDILEDKRVEIARAMSIAMQPVQAERDVVIPSAIAFRRYIAAFFDVFHTSLPFMHGPTWRANDQEPALLLAVAAVGAATCGKTSLSFNFHRAAQLSLWKHLHSCQFSPHNQPIWLAQSLLLVMLFGTYSGNATVMQEVLPYQPILASIVRYMINAEEFNATSRDDPNLSWEEWIGIETIIRTTFATYTYFGQLNLVLNLPFSLVISEIDIHLPCSEEEWHVATLESWRRFREQKKPCLIRFSDAYKLLVAEQGEQSVGWSPLGALVMLHAILQHMWHLRQCSQGNLTLAEIELLEKTLARWEAMCDIGLQQSSLTNKSLPRTLELDANALFEFAFFTLYANVGYPKPTLLTHSIDQVASAIGKQVKEAPRTPSNSKAAKYSTKVLLILFNSGFVWRNKILTGACSLQLHIISSLKCCLYLSSWLPSLYSVDAGSWTEEERQVVTTIEAMLQEMDIPPENYGKAAHIQLLYAWCSMFKDTDQSGVAPFLVKGVQGYADRC